MYQKKKSIRSRDSPLHFLWNLVRSQAELFTVVNKLDLQCENLSVFIVLLKCDFGHVERGLKIFDNENTMINIASKQQPVWNQSCLFRMQRANDHARDKWNMNCERAWTCLQHSYDNDRTIKSQGSKHGGWRPNMSCVPFLTCVSSPYQNFQPKPLAS